MNQFRIENDLLGQVNVQADKYWGAQTQRTLENFDIGHEFMPHKLIMSMVLIKKAAAIVHKNLRMLDDNIADAIVSAANEIMVEHKYLTSFPLTIWQSGSGTQTNMNVNEVIANRAIEILGGEIGSKTPVHPNDHVNMGQSTNDTFPAATQIAVVHLINHKLLPALQYMNGALENKVKEFADVIKVGRTHLQDAVPISLGQEFSGYATQIEKAMGRVNNALPNLLEIPQGGTAVGTGISAHKKFADYISIEIANMTGYKFVSAKNKFEGIAASDAILEFSGVLNVIAASLNKIAKDLILLGSGPRAGIGELILPENELGSSIMPGKVNPTQCEAIQMICALVFGNHTSITFACANGTLELNTYRPLIAHLILQSTELLANGIISFVDHCIAGIQHNESRIKQLLGDSLMLATALNKHIGYDKAAAIAYAAHHKNISLREAALQSGFVDEKQFDMWINPEEMV